MSTLSRLALLPAIALAGCAGGQKVESKPADVAVTVDRVMPMPESLDASAVEVTLKLYNPAEKAVQISTVDYSIDTQDVGGKLSGTAEGGGKIEPNQEAEIKFRQSIPFPADLEQYKKILERKTIPINLAGKVKLGDGRSYSFERVSEVATPELPIFVVHDAQAARYEKAGLDVTLFLRLINDNPFPVLIEGLTYTVWVGDKKIKTEQAAVGARLIANAAEEYEVGAVLSEKSLGKDRLRQVLSDRKVSYRVEGQLELRRLTIPFEHTGEIELATGE